MVVSSWDGTSAKPMTEPDCASASGQAQIGPCGAWEITIDALCAEDLLEVARCS